MVRSPRRSKSFGRGSANVTVEARTPGPQGATGPAGPTGATGPQGATGPSGASVVSKKTYAALDTTFNAAWSCADASPLDLTTVVDVRALILPTIWNVAGNQVLVSKFDTAANERSYQFALTNIGAKGGLLLVFSKDGSGTTFSASSTVGFPNPFPTTSPAWVRGVLTSNDGTGKSSFAFYYSLDNAATWIQLGTTVTNATPGPLFSGTAPVYIGVRKDGTLGFSGRIYKAEIRDGSAVLVANFDATARPDSSAFADTLGNTWTPGSTGAIASDPYVGDTDVLSGSLRPGVLANNGTAIANGWMLRYWNGSVTWVAPRAVNPSAYGAVGAGGLGATETAANTAGFQAAIAAIPTGGSQIGGVIEMMGGDYAIDQPLILPDKTRFTGLSADGATIIRPSPRFPTMTLSGSHVFPAATTIQLVSVPANLPASGVVSLVTGVGAIDVNYGSVDLGANQLLGCTTTGSGTAADASIVGTYLFILGQPHGTPFEAFSTRLENFQISCGTGSSGSTWIPGCCGVYSNRIQEHGGLRDMLITQICRKGVKVDASVGASLTAQNWQMQGVRLGVGKTFCEATCVGMHIYGNNAPVRGVSDMTLSSEGGLQATAGTIGLLIQASQGSFSDFQIEYVTDAIVLDYAPTKKNGPVTIRNQMGANTNQVRITTGGVAPVALYDISRVGGSTLISDQSTATTVTDANIGMYRMSALASGHRWVFSDSWNLGTPYVPVNLAAS